MVCIFLNSERFIGEAIESVLSQDFADWELILVDDGSSDASTAIAQNLARRMPEKVRYLEHPGHANRGTSASHNLGLSVARGEFIAFIDSDDRWRPGKLTGQIALLDEHRDCAMVCGGVNYWSSWEGGDDAIVQTGGVTDTMLLPPEALARLYPIGRAAAAGPSEVMLRRSAIAAVGGFEDEFTGMYDDQALFTKIYLAYPVWFSSHVWVDYRLSSDSICATAKRNNTALAHRRRFFAWLVPYLEARSSLAGPAILAAARRELWLLERPVLWKIGFRLAGLVKRLRPDGFE